jgi:ribonucleoside-diphosphate reductase alpha chain
MDLERLGSVVCTAVRMLDNIIELERYPTQRQASVARSTRRVGLGVMGLDDAFRMLGIEYGSEDSLSTVAALLERVRAAAYAASIELAAERGAFPRFAEGKRAFVLSGALPAPAHFGLARSNQANHFEHAAPRETLPANRWGSLSDTACF